LFGSCSENDEGQAVVTGIPTESVGCVLETATFSRAGLLSAGRAVFDSALDFDYIELYRFSAGEDCSEFVGILACEAQ
jgi:hypothetical protein